MKLMSPEEETTSPTARGPRAEQTSGETDAGGDDIEIEEDDEGRGGPTFGGEETPN